jgi:hypothetical protein
MAEGFFEKAHVGMDNAEKRVRPSKRIKASQGEAQERWELKHIPKDLNGLRRTEGSQTLNAGLLRNRANFLKRCFNMKREQRVFGSENAVGHGSSSEVLVLLLVRRHSASLQAASLGGIR